MAPRIVSREVAFRTPWFSVVAKQVEGGAQAADAPHYVVVPPDYVTVLAVTEDRRIPMVRQYRPALERTVLELPSGHVEAGEAPAAAALRELHEETGYTAERVWLLGQLAPDTGRLGNRLWGYFAPCAEKAPDEDWQPEPGVAVVHQSTADLADLVADGGLEHANDLAVIALAVAQGRLEGLAR